jgi:hypothetical protein
VTADRGARRKQRREDSRTTSSSATQRNGEDVLPSDLSGKVLNLARRQLDDDDEGDVDAQIDVNVQPDALAAVASGTQFVTDNNSDEDDDDNDGTRAKPRVTKVLRDGKGRAVDFSSDEEAVETDENFVTDGGDFEVRF